jgi:hypothetical protein
VTEAKSTICGKDYEAYGTYSCRKPAGHVTPCGYPGDEHDILARAKEIRPEVIAAHSHCCSEPGCDWDGFVCQCRDIALEHASEEFA